MSGDWVHPGQALIWVIWIFAATVRGSVTEEPTRYTRLGWVKGKQVTVLGSLNPVNVFLGIPFAAPPLGDLRFSNPRPASPWHDLREATTYPKLCFQDPEWLSVYQRMLKVHYPKFGVSEDCLYLNIYAPAHANNGSSLPVMVWIPGGGFETGSASIFDGSALAAYEDVLIVTIQYRLGIFGFFNTRDQNAPGNWAFQDQLAALLWVQENIKFFGGNPDSVTIFGGSAGAISISSLVISPLSKGLFHRAIMESGVAIIPSPRTLDAELKTDLQVVADVCGADVSDSQTLLWCLRKMSSLELLSLGKKTKSFTRVVDGSFFPDEPLELLSQKTFKAVPSIIGVNNQECGYILPMRDTPEILLGSNETVALNLIHVFLHIPTQYLHVVAKEYFQGMHSMTDIRDTLLDLFGDVFFVVPGLVTARYHRDAGAPVYFYEFQHRPQCFENTRPAFVKADHTDEIRFVFGGPFLKGDIAMFEEATEEEKSLSRKMMEYWANFARSGNPNGDGLPQWPVYDQDERYLMLNLNISVGQRLKDRRVEFWTDTLPLIMSASEALLSSASSLTLLSLSLPFLFSVL
ncbi:carboxylesterase 5A [Phodopus roborovskii]|uniref:Carboxylic ester hydrolase n=1 Tax=Phodopus roborovskii TaxID=109678 RepID=A0AAU9ZQU5_PHORO|nr:carboxylesterase 5A [Phodopus roborovskii]CAH6817706.1 Ces5a [Phodopus roborovskii]